MTIISKAKAEELGIKPIKTKSGRDMYIDNRKTEPKPKKPKEPKKKGKLMRDGEVITSAGCVDPKRRTGKKTKTGLKTCKKDKKDLKEQE